MAHVKGYVYLKTSALLLNEEKIIHAYGKTKINTMRAMPRKSGALRSRLSVRGLVRGAAEDNSVDKLGLVTVICVP